MFNLNRLFEQYNKRVCNNLDGFWNFKIDPDNIGVKDKWFENFPDESDKIVVPSCWNNEFDLYEYEGLAWYSTKFEVSSNNIRVYFHGFTGMINVYVDGKKAGEKYGGFAGYGVTIKDMEPGEHTLTVSIDSTHDSLNTIPLAVVDWYHYGGLFRSVEIMELNDIWIKDYQVDYKLTNSLESVELSISLMLENFTDEISREQLKVYLEDEVILEKEVEVEGETKLELIGLIIDDIKLWDIFKPNLYNIRFEIGKDDITERIGFRKIEVKGKKLHLNGRQIDLKGINRHEDHPDWGFALPLKLMKKDLDIIKDMGCNAVRGSHYPNSKLFLDLCDQEGILFWEEIPMWGFPEDALKNPLILERGLDMHETMVKRDYHHPSIIIWGMHNEIDTRTDAAYQLTNRFIERVKGLDKSRLITYATFYPLRDRCYDLVDIVSVNKYYGWYEEDITYWSECLDKLKEKLSKEGLNDKPIIISEFGAGGLYGYNTFESPLWTENFQEDYLEYTLDLFLNHSDVIGTYIWQFCDIRTAREKALGRPRSFNNKGILNEYRSPKPAYWTAKKIYNKK